MKCKCKAWASNDKHMTAVMHTARTHGTEYRGTKMLYCPWCGKKLEEGQ